MAIIARGHTPCSICGAMLMSDDVIVATTHFIAHPLDPLHSFSDTGMHRGCFDTWSYRDAFTARYRAALARFDPAGVMGWPGGDAPGRPDVPQREPEPWHFTLDERKPGIFLALIPSWEALSTATVLLGVRADQADAAALQALPSYATIGPVARLRELVDSGDRGIAAILSPLPPTPLPRDSGAAYFLLDPGAGRLWAEPDAPLGLAVRLRGTWPRLNMQLWALLPA